MPLGISIVWIPSGRIPKWPTGADCKSAVLRLRWFESSSYHHLYSRPETCRIANIFRPIDAIFACGIVRFCALTVSCLLFQSDAHKSYIRHTNRDLASPLVPPAGESIRRSAVNCARNLCIGSPRIESVERPGRNLFLNCVNRIPESSPTALARRGGTSGGCRRVRPK